MLICIGDGIRDSLLKEEDHAQWIGTKTDLIEIVHYVYEAQIIRTQEGEPATF